MARRDVTHVDHGGISIDLTRHGDGSQEAVLLHAAPFQCWYRPLIARLEVITDIAVFTYQRRIGTGEFGFTADADAVLLALRQAGAERVHVVGHSWGGILALEIARRAPAAVRSLALLEPAPTAFLDAEQTAATFAPLLNRARVEGAEAAMRQFLEVVLGDAAEELLRRYVSDGVDEAARWAEQFFAAEVPAIIPWTYGGDDAAAVEAPVLLVSGAASTPRFRTGAELLTGWFPDAEHLELEEVGHLIMAAQPDQVAAGLRAFWGCRLAGPRRGLIGLASQERPARLEEEHDRRRFAALGDLAKLEGVVQQALSSAAMGMWLAPTLSRMPWSVHDSMVQDSSR